MSPEGLPANLEGATDQSPDALVILPVADRWSLLFEAEQAALASQHPRRIAGYSSARRCAHLALIDLGLAPQPIGREESGAPGWPEGVRGSLTHSNTLAAACVGPPERSVGIDLEELGRMSDGVAQRVLTDSEQAEADHLSQEDAAARATLIFSAKEAVYKAIFPLAGAYIGYREAEICLDEQRQQFRARYLGSHTPSARMADGTGCYWRLGNVVLTKFWVPVE